ncbi:hypothetical protein [Burkholderia gladioli]|uniref:hypothetical protein n=1 Tax=Burkholderia gladioli TaxID=28095 RepID=UPI001FC83F4E|nr:hypothetical protein [Burkholderia gladioli]
MMIPTQTAQDTLAALARAGFEISLPLSIAPVREERDYRALVAAGLMALNLPADAWADTEMWAVVAAHANVHGLVPITELQAARLRLTPFETGAANTVIALAARIATLAVTPGRRAA